MKFYFILFLISSCAIVKSSAQPKTWIHYDTSNSNLKANEISDLTFDSNGRVWICTYSNHIQCFDKSTWIQKDAITITTNGYPQTFIEGKDELIYVIGKIGYLQILDPIKLKINEIKVPEGVQFTRGICLRNGSLLLGGVNGNAGKLYTYSKSKFKLVGSFYSDIFSLTEINDSCVWISFRNGTKELKIKNETYTINTEPFCEKSFYNIEIINKDSAIGSTFPDMHVYVLSADTWNKVSQISEAIFYDFNGSWQYCSHKVFTLSDGRMGMYTQFGAHIALLDSGRWKCYSLPIPNTEFDGIQCIKENRDGMLWVGTWHHGVYCIDKENLAQLPQSKLVKRIKPKQNQSFFQQEIHPVDEE